MILWSRLPVRLGPTFYLGCPKKNLAIPSAMDPLALCSGRLLNFFIAFYVQACDYLAGIFRYTILKRQIIGCA